MEHLRFFWPPCMNLPLGGHRILVVGLGRLDRHGRMHRWQICCYPMQLSFCCGRNEDL